MTFDRRITDRAVDRLDVHCPGADTVQGMKPPMHKAPPVTSIARRTRAHDVADQIEKMIAAGEVKAGDRLPAHKELMERFGVGRPAVREALFFLQQQGLVEIVNGTRARVALGTRNALSQQLPYLFFWQAEEEVEEEEENPKKSPLMQAPMDDARQARGAEPPTSGPKIGGSRRKRRPCFHRRNALHWNQLQFLQRWLMQQYRRTEAETESQFCGLGPVRM